MFYKGIFELAKFSNRSHPTCSDLVAQIHQLFDLYGWKGNNVGKWGAIADPAYPQAFEPDIPYAFVALGASNKVVGTISLVQNDRLDLPHLNPWVAGLVVDECHRKRGIGSALLLAAESFASLLVSTPLIQDGMLYLDTERTHDPNQPEWYERRGWFFLDPDSKDEQEKIVMCKCM